MWAGEDTTLSVFTDVRVVSMRCVTGISECFIHCYESEFTRIRSYIVLSPRKIWPKNGLLTGCSRNFDPIFDPIIIAKCSQWGFLRLRITVGRIGDGKKVYYKMYLGSITLMKTYTALFAAIGGRDGMDAGRVHQMTCAIYGTHQPLVLGSPVSRLEKDQD
jgi:hypothetical protein